MSQTFDLIVIGAGPGGYVAAIRAAQLGLKTAIVERERLGGVCLNWGCIPTKALLRTAEVFHLMAHAGEFGLAADNIRFDPSAVVQRSRKVADRLSSGVAFLLRKHKINVLFGDAALTRGTAAPKVVVREAGGKQSTLEAKHVILATGARARTIPQAGLAPGPRVWTYREAMVPPLWPDSLVVFGSGAIGIEFASFYAALGVKVTVLEIADRILPAEDEEISAFARKRFEKQGIVIRTGAKGARLQENAEGVLASAEIDGALETFPASCAILAVGIVANLEGLGLEGRGVATERGAVVTDALARTSAPGLYAIGDVAGPPWLAHKASHEGIVCVEAIAGLKPHPMRRDRIPGCTYAHPQIASVGLTEAAARASDRAVKVGRFPFVGNGKAIALGEDQGLVKTIFDAVTGELLGAHMVGAEVTELIQGYVVAMSAEATEAELAETIFAHPTLSEMMHEAVLDAYGRAIHI